MSKQRDRTFTPALITVDPAYTIGRLDKRLRGALVEHMGRCVYEGIVEPGHPAADANGFRTDVADLVKGLGTTLVRYPGGNFASSHNWRDGVGPLGERPSRLNLAWSSLEPNTFGLDEMARWAELVGAEMLYTVNLGTRGIKDACDLVEYANFPGGTLWSDLRIKNGAPDPYRIRTWCLGNEMDGSWQVGHSSAASYAELAAQVARAMRLVDPTIELVVSGSSKRSMPTFPAWDAEVLSRTYELVDHLGLHSYHWQYDDDLPSFLAASTDLDQFLDAAIATVDHVGATLRSSKRLSIALDEWGVSFTDESWRDEHHYWKLAPPIAENDYTALDAVVTGGLLNAILRRGDRVRIACLALLVNVSSPIRTAIGGGSWAQSTYHPVAAVARHAGSMALRAAVTSPTIETGRFGPVTALDVAATLDESSGAVALFVANRSELKCPTTIKLRGERPTIVFMETLDAFEAPGATNSLESPSRVRMTPNASATVVDEGAECVFPPRSWSVLRIADSART